MLGGALTDAAGWRWVFLVNLPFAVVASVLAWRFAPRGRPAGVRPASAAGQLAAIVALGALTFALIEGGARGWTSAVVLFSFVVAAVSAVWLVGHERRTPAPLLPLSLLADRRFSASTGAGALVNLAFYGELFVLSLFLQQERGLTALEAGLAFLPQPLLTMAVAPVTGRLVATYGPRLPLGVGGVFATLGAVLLLGVDVHSGYGVLAGGLVLTGLGGGLMIPALTAAVVGAAPARLAGTASAGLNAGRQVGGAIGVALLGSLAATGDAVAGLHVAVALAAVALLGATLLARALPEARAARVVTA